MKYKVIKASTITQVFIFITIVVAVLVLLSAVLIPILNYKKATPTPLPVIKFEG